MKDGFIKCAAAGMQAVLANPKKNAQQIIHIIKAQDEAGVQLLVFPELSLSGYTCGDLFYQQSLLEACNRELIRVMKETEETEVLACIGMPFMYGNNVYNVAAMIQKGKLLGLVPKTYIPNYGDVNESRYFAQAPEKNIELIFNAGSVYFGTKLLFVGPKGLVVGCEICEDMWTPVNPATYHVLAGANVIVNLAASTEGAGKTDLRRSVIVSNSMRMCCGYVYASGGAGESSTDAVFGAHHMIAENGSILSEAEVYQSETISAEIDIASINECRRKSTSFTTGNTDDYQTISFTLREQETKLSRKYEKQPFLYKKNGSYHECLQEIFKVQVHGLARRLSHIHCENAVLGLSGGLDSTLAILVAAKAFDVLGLDRSGILAVTMPCFGTTNRTYDNACMLAKEIGATLKEVPIKKAMLQHFEDINQSLDNHDVTYENAQARERTQVIMDMANQCNGLVIGTGDLSELALGWATYNGDHMSMYAVNASIPKTVIRYMVEDLASDWESDAMEKVLLDILDTPVSPELLPPVDGTISQKTEDLVGPYELHDFFLYHMFVYGSSPSKIYRIAALTFEAEYSKETILKWLKIFYRRFFTQQFKRSCMPDGPKATSISFSPRTSLHMPSDAYSELWLEELEQITI